MKISLASWELELAREPFTFAVRLGEHTLLQSRPHAEPVVDIRSEGGAIEVAFPSSALTLIPDSDSISVRWRGSTANHQLLITNYLYGLGQLIHQLWPLNRAMLPAAEFLTADNGATGLSCILTPALLSSNGLGLVLRSPARLGLNQPPASYPRYQWGLGSYGPFAQRPFADPGGAGDGLLTLSGDDLEYDLLLTGDLPALHRLLVARHFSHPARTPPAELFTRPTWTTWARYKTDINQARVLGFAQEIVAHRYPYHVMEIDDRWQVHYGDLGFDPARFPDPKGLIARLHDLGFKITAWVIPFLDPESRAFAEGARNGYLVREQSGAPYLVPWWQGRGGLLDVSNPAALDWFLTRLRALQDSTGLDGFKFDAGEAIFLPRDAVTHTPAHPNDYPHRYVNFVANHFSLCEVRAGWQNQSAPLFFRQWDKTTGWGLDNGLHSVLTGILSLALTGYPFVLPDMIGGNAYNESPDAELMIRWTQLNALLPAMQFSLAPWDYGGECDELCRRYADLHTEFAPLILRLAGAAARTGEPIIRPVLWLAPHAERALRCDDEFLVGDEVLVAPVVQPGARSRPIYFPPGRWRDHWSGRLVEGPATVDSYPAPLDRLPLFQRG